MGATSCSICADENFAPCSAAAVSSGFTSPAAQTGRATSVESVTRANHHMRYPPDPASLRPGRSNISTPRDPPSTGDIVEEHLLLEPARVLPYRAIHSQLMAPMPVARIAPVAISTGRRRTAPPSATAMPHFTIVLVRVARTIALTATCASPLLAYSAMDSVMASTSVRPANPATM